MNKEIRIILLDVDGIIVGEKIGYNSPFPSPKVISALTLLKKCGYKVCFCTGKPYLAIADIVHKCALNDLHVTDGGAVLFNPLTNVSVKQVILKNRKAVNLINEYISKDIYIELYTDENYYIQENQECYITEKHTYVLQKSPVKVKSLADISLGIKITKAMIIAQDEKKILQLQNIFDINFQGQFNLRWGVHPAILPLQFGIITNQEVSKGEMLFALAHYYNVPVAHILSVGDSTSDWDYMQHTGYVATLDNGTDKLKDLLITKGVGHFTAGGHVDKDGIIDVFKYFKLI